MSKRFTWERLLESDGTFKRGGAFWEDLRSSWVSPQKRALGSNHPLPFLAKDGNGFAPPKAPTLICCFPTSPHTVRALSHRLNRQHSSKASLFSLWCNYPRHFVIATTSWRSQKVSAVNGGKRQWKLTFNPSLPALAVRGGQGDCHILWLRSVSQGLLVDGEGSPGQKQDDACIQTGLASFL